MKSSLQTAGVTMSARELQIVEMIDWHDGIVLAVVSTNWMEGNYLASLIALDVESRRRVIALSPLSEGDLSEVRARIGGDWELLLLYLKRLWDKAAGNISVIYWADRDGRVVAEATMDAGNLKDQAGSDVETAVRKDRMKWFDIFHPTA
jgi:hypothetical protein